MNGKNIQIEGINAVSAAIASGRKIERIFISHSAKPGRMRELIEGAQEKCIPMEYAARNELDKMSLTQHHHGVIAIMPEEDKKLFEDAAEDIVQNENNPLFVMLDGVQDPHNLGAVIRTAECAGASCVVIPERRSAKVTAVAANASAGAINLIPVFRSEKHEPRDRISAEAGRLGAGHGRRRQKL